MKTINVKKRRNYLSEMCNNSSEIEM